MKFFNSMLWKMLFLVLMVPPTAFSARSTGHLAGMHTSAIAPGGTVTSSEINSDPIEYRRMAHRRNEIPNFDVFQNNAIKPIGDLTGSITYPDGQITLLGTLGNATLDSKTQTLFLPSGQRISMKTAEKSARQVAATNQVQL